MIQDDKREIELVKLFKLKQNTNRKRSDIDAYLELNGKDFKFELKSTTVGSVSTASPLTFNHLHKWKSMHWIIGVYNKNAKLQHCYYGSPKDMMEWITFWETDIKRGILISDLLVDKIDFDIMYKVFGKKDFYKKSDIEGQIKKTFNNYEYELMKDVKEGYSPSRVLEMFKESNRKYLYAGSNVNNPKITPNYYKKWHIIKENYAEELRKVLIKNIDTSKKSSKI